MSAFEGGSEFAQTSGAIRHKIKQALFRHRKKILRDLLKEIPTNCVHHVKIPVPLEFRSDEETVLGMCGLRKEGWPVQTCDEGIEGDLEKAMSCPSFKARTGKSQVREELKVFFQKASDIEIHGRFPDVGALMWVLGFEKTREFVVSNLELEE